MSAQPTEQQPDEAVEQPDPADLADPVQPAEADPEASGKVIALPTTRGALTLRPDQVDLDPRQAAALVAIGIDVHTDPAVQPHIRPFMHMCQIRGLDPWAREAYLIGRGTGDNRKYTMQVGIDGYRKMAGNTGRFIRVKETLWTGQEDDDRSWYRDERGVMRRVWWDQWPSSRGYPGAAKVVIEHYDESGEITETEAIADWTMYAPFSDKWEWHPTQRGKKVYPRDDEGKPIKVLNEMWTKGFAHMLAKCAEALAHRRAFPGTMNGIYVHEEMHRADVEERARVASIARTRRQEAHARAVGITQVSAPQQPSPQSGEQSGEWADEPEGAAPSGPIVVGDVVGEVLDQMPGAPAAEQPEQSEQPDAQTEAEPEARIGGGEPAQESGETDAQSDAQSDAQPARPDAREDAHASAQEPAQARAQSAGERADLLRAELEFQAGVLGHPVRTLARRPMQAARKDVADFTDAELLPLVVGLRPGVVARLDALDRQRDAALYADLVDSTEVVDVARLLDPAVEEVVEADLVDDDPRMDADPTKPHEYVEDGGLCALCGEEQQNRIHPTKTRRRKGR